MCIDPALMIKIPNANYFVTHISSCIWAALKLIDQHPHSVNMAVMCGIEECCKASLHETTHTFTIYVHTMRTSVHSQHSTHIQSCTPRTTFLHTPCMQWPTTYVAPHTHHAHTVHHLYIPYPWLCWGHTQTPGSGDAEHLFAQSWLHNAAVTMIPTEVGVRGQRSKAV